MGNYIKKFPKDIQIGDCISMLGRNVVSRVEYTLEEPPFFAFTLDDGTNIYTLEDEDIYIYIRDSENFT